MTIDAAAVGLDGLPGVWAAMNAPAPAVELDQAVRDPAARRAWLRWCHRVTTDDEEAGHDVPPYDDEFYGDSPTVPVPPRRRRLDDLDASCATNRGSRRRQRSSAAVRLVQVNRRRARLRAMVDAGVPLAWTVRLELDDLDDLAEELAALVCSIPLDAAARSRRAARRRSRHLIGCRSPVPPRSYRPAIPPPNAVDHRSSLVGRSAPPTCPIGSPSIGSRSRLRQVDMPQT